MEQHISMECVLVHTFCWFGWLFGWLYLSILRIATLPYMIIMIVVAIVNQSVSGCMGDCTGCIGSWKVRSESAQWRVSLVSVADPHLLMCPLSHRVSNRSL